MIFEVFTRHSGDPSGRQQDARCLFHQGCLIKSHRLSKVTSLWSGWHHAYLALVAIGLAVSCTMTPATGPEGANGPSSNSTKANPDSKVKRSNLQVNPLSVNFGNVQVGTKSTQPVTITNTGSVSLVILQASVTGSGFSISGLLLPLTLNPGSYKTFNATFSPEVSGLADGNIAIVVNILSSPISVKLSGTGTSSFTYLLSLSPSSTNFGNVSVGSKSTLPVEMINTGTGSVTVTKANLTGATFSISSLSLPLTILARKNDSFNVTFAPTTTGVFNGNVSIVSNATNSPANEPLSGTGVNAPYVSLSWDASTSKNITGYNVYRGVQVNGPFNKINTSLVPSTSYQDNSVYAGDTYYYVTTAVDTQGVESAYSNEAKATLPSS